jgi:hypothetical protein
MAQVLEALANKYKALSSNPSTEKKPLLIIPNHPYLSTGLVFCELMVHFSCQT